MLTIDVDRARRVAARLLWAYQNQGIFGNQSMPEDLNPPGVTSGSEEHLRFITLTVAIDYMRDADQLWNAARATYAEPDLRYLFDPISVASASPLRVSDDMQRHRLSRKPTQDARTWQEISTTLARHFEGRVKTLVKAVGFDAPNLLKLVRDRRYASGFPFLKGAKIGSLWVRMLHDNGQVPFHRMDEIGLPVDIHTAQATVQLGCAKPEGVSGSMAELRDAVQQVWKQALAGAPDEDYPLRLDEPLWLLSRQGCRTTRTWPCEHARACPVSEYCQPNHMWLSTDGGNGNAPSEWKIERRG